MLEIVDASRLLSKLKGPFKVKFNSETKNQ